MAEEVVAPVVGLDEAEALVAWAAAELLSLLLVYVSVLLLLYYHGYHYYHYYYYHYYYYYYYYYYWVWNRCERLRGWRGEAQLAFLRPAYGLLITNPNRR